MKILLTLLMLLSPLAYSADTPGGAVSEFTANEELILYTVVGGSVAVSTGLVIDAVSLALLPIVPEVAIPVLIGSTILGTSLVAGGGISLSIGYGAIIESAIKDIF
jgi:hypothetical protein